MDSYFSMNSTIWQIKQYLHTANQWISQTPERALEKAYQAALKIKFLEEEYFNGGETFVISDPENDCLMPAVQADLAKFLRTTKLRLAEFQVSYSVVGHLIPDYLEKLKFIDDVLGKYATQNDVQPLLPPLLAEKNTDRQADSLLAENGHKEASIYSSQQERTQKPKPQMQQPSPRPVNRLVYAGLASSLVVGGFAAGAASSWMLLPHEHAAANKQNAAEVNPQHAAASHTRGTQMKVSPSAPESMSLESNASFSSH